METIARMNLALLHTSPTAPPCRGQCRHEQCLPQWLVSKKNGHNARLNVDDEGILSVLENEDIMTTDRRPPAAENLAINAEEHLPTAR